MHKQFDGWDDVLIAPATDPWLQYPNGEVVPLDDYLQGLPDGPDGCRAGFFAPTDNGPTDQGIERCDECQIYPGDMDAALALAALIGPGITVWYEHGQD